jgi:hypothetical protein
MVVSIYGGTPLAGWYIMENPIQMDDYTWELLHLVGGFNHLEKYEFVNGVGMTSHI